jgi:eukaryotic-like serine/threonine-protein kinase
VETQFEWLKFVGKALLQVFPGGGLVAEATVEIGPKVAELLWRLLSKKTGGRPKPALLAEVAAASQRDLRAAVERIVEELGSDLPEEARLVLTTYLMHVQASVRRGLRRESDPSGTTIPANMVLRQADDLLPLLPGKLPRLWPGYREGDLELEELLGVGGFGEVWKARNIHRPLAEPVALKFCTDEGAAKTLLTEIELLDRVQKQGKGHPGFVQLRNTYLSARPPFLEYEYVEGGDLAGLIQEWHRQDGPSPTEAAKVMLRLADIVGFAHRQARPIVHRDLKPANILVQMDDQGRRQFKIADFGIGAVAARQTIRRDRSGLTSRSEQQATTALGACTVLYASPQQQRGGPADPRDDVYSLGVIWYQLLQGDLGAGRPGGSRWKEELAERGMSRNLIGLLESCFEDDPDHRPRDAAVLAERLRAALGGGARRSEQGQEGPPPVSRRVVLTAVASGAGLLVMLLGIGLSYAWKSKGPDPPPPPPPPPAPSLVGRWAGPNDLFDFAPGGTFTAQQNSPSGWQSFAGTWSKSGNNLVLSYTSPVPMVITWQIEEVTEGQLVVSGWGPAGRQVHRLIRQGR